MTRTWSPTVFSSPGMVGTFLGKGDALVCVCAVQILFVVMNEAKGKEKDDEKGCSCDCAMMVM